MAAFKVAGFISMWLMSFPRMIYCNCLRTPELLETPHKSPLSVSWMSNNE